MKKYLKSSLVLPLAILLVACGNEDTKVTIIDDKDNNEIKTDNIAKIDLKEKLNNLMKDEDYVKQFDLSENPLNDSEINEEENIEKKFDAIKNKAGDSYLWFYYDVGSLGGMPMLTLTSGTQTVWLTENFTEEQLKEFQDLAETNTPTLQAAIEGYYDENDEFILGTPTRKGEFILNMHEIESKSIIPEGKKENIIEGFASLENMRLSSETGVTITIILEDDEEKSTYPILVGEKTIEKLFYIENEKKLYKVVYFEINGKGYFMFGDKNNFDKIISK